MFKNIFRFVDKNENGVADWLEFIIGYGIAGFLLYMAYTEFMSTQPEYGLITWLITVAGGIVGFRQVKAKGITTKL